MVNKAFWRSIHSLTHPVSILAVLVLLFNDHYLRHVSPSWMTGKLGDFTWLLFAPFVAGLLFAFVIPRRVKNHERVVGLVSIGFIGVWFATAKTIPLVHHITTEALAWLVGWEGQLRLDVTDLLTLPALLISWYVWRNVPDTQINLKPYAPIIFSLAILGTLASDSMPDSGVTCLGQDNGAIYTQLYNSTFISTDGGLSWQPFAGSFIGICADYYEGASKNSWTLDTEDLDYAIFPGERIEGYQDSVGGITYDLSHYRFDVRKIYYEHSPEFIQYVIGPLDGEIHAETGNLVLAMSLDGVLVITPDGEHIWSAIDQYEFSELTETDLYGLLDGALLAAVGLFALTGLTLFIHNSGMSGTFMLGLLWLVWLFGAGIYYPTMGGLDSLFMGIGGICTAIVGLFFVFYVIDTFFKRREVIMPVLLLTTAIMLAFLLPYILWVENRIPEFNFAKGFATIPTIFLVYFAHWRIQSRYFPTPPSPPPPAKNHDIDATVDPFETE